MRGWAGGWGSRIKSVEYDIIDILIYKPTLNLWLIYIHRNILS